MALKRPKQKGVAKRKKAQVAPALRPVAKKEVTGPDEERDPDEYYSDEVKSLTFCGMC